ncbi:MAG: acyltransferase family protein [Paludibacteraceae bacterium]|nr:acyltransferase family protein [Paludibacteraceae bacterium]
MQIVVLNNKGYEPFIDFMKGLCILWVVLTHSIPYHWQQMIGFPFWGAQAVPIFLLIQSYHYFKHEDLPTVNWGKLFKRIILPYLVVESIIVLHIIIAYLCGSGVLSTPLRSLFLLGGNGPGSYYVWIYLQFALIILPLFGWLQKKLAFSDFTWGIVFVIVSEVLEILCSIWHPSEYIYRLLAFRYIFLAYGGYIWAKHFITNNWITINLSIISIISIYIFQYKNFTFEPWIFNTDWRYFHWFCYFLAIFLLPAIANISYRLMGGVFAEFIKYLGKYSYQIFLFQLLVFYWFPLEINSWAYMIATTLLSIVPVLVYYAIKERWQIINK